MSRPREVLKALVLAGGRGRRMEELSERESKCMLTLKGRRLIEYSLDNAAALPEVAEIIIVVGYRGETIINAFGTAYQGKQLTYVIQKEQLGVVHAMETAREALNGADFFLFLADEVVLGARHRQMLELFRREDLFCVCGVYPQPHLDLIRRTYAVIHGPEGRIHRLIEKPRNPRKPLMGTGNMVIKAAVFDYVGVTPVNPHRGEKELPDLIQSAIDDGEAVKLLVIGDHYLNLNSLQEWQEAEARWPVKV